MRCVGGDDTNGGFRVADWDTITERWLRIICLFERFVSDTDFHLLFSLSFHLIAHTVASHYVRVPMLNDVPGIVLWHFSERMLSVMIFCIDGLPIHIELLCAETAQQNGIQKANISCCCWIFFFFVFALYSSFPFPFLLDVVVSLFYIRITATLARMSIVRRLHICSVAQHQRQ